MSRVALAMGTAVAAIATIAAFQPNPTASRQTPAKVTYSQDVAPILNERCVSCHRPGEVGPFSLETFADAQRWAPMIAVTTSSRRMPPWKAKAGYGEFKHENRLSEGEISILKTWASTGTLKGDLKKAPAKPKFATGEWPLGTPDMVITPSATYQVDAEGTDDYRNFVIDPKNDKPIYVTGLDVRPGNRKVVHHVIAFLDNSGASIRLSLQSHDGKPGYPGTGGGVGFIPAGSLGGWAPGIQPTKLTPGTAYKIDPGTKIVLQVHYHKSGKPETDLTKVALYTTETPPERVMNLNWIFNFRVDIPAGEKNYNLRREYTYTKDVVIHSAMPHMHLLGREMKSWFELPDGRTIPLVHVDDWDFNWQLNYFLKEPLSLPAGTKQIVEAKYDNSSDNPNNPNSPPKRVRWGEETTDEMFLMVTNFTYK